MLQKVFNFIKKENMLKENDTIICATSGGVDSICLLHILINLGYNPILAHVNHHKRIESDIEENEMKLLAEKLNIPFELLNFYSNDDNNFQAEAHKARYDFFRKIADKYNTNIISTAHHLDDQAETILMRLINGSNLYGYAGIASNISFDGYKIVRPLLCLNKSELYDYAKANNLNFFEDVSNDSDDYLRNRIRHNVIPLLKKENPNLLNKLADFSLQTREAFNYVRKHSIKYLDELNNNIKVESFKELDIALQKDIICLLLERNNLEKSNETISLCLSFILKNNNGKIDIKNKHYLNIEYGIANVLQHKDTIAFDSTIDINNGCNILGKYFFYFSKKIPQNNANYIKLCYNTLKLPLKIRNKQVGDFISMSYGRKKIARILIDAKIPEHKRNEIPLVIDGDGNILWVYGLAKSQSVIEQKSKYDIFLVCEERKND